jgi:hypothetical protein
MTIDSSIIARPPRITRRRKYWIAILLAGAALVGGSYVWLFYQSNRAIRDALAEADRLDPGWRLSELEEARSVVPQDANSARLVMAARSQLPLVWPKWMLTKPNGTGLVDGLEELSPEISLSESQRQELATGLKSLAAPLASAKKVIGMPEGRYGIKWDKDGVGTPMPHLHGIRLIVDLLRFEAISHADSGDLTSACRSLQAMICTGRSLGDEPAGISQWTRRHCSQHAIVVLERVLAQGELTPAELKTLQDLLVEEVKHPAQLIAARADRAGIQEYLALAEKLETDRARYNMRPSMLGYRYDNVVDMMRAKQAHSNWLHYLTAYVQIAKLPEPEQKSAFAELQMPDSRLPDLLESLFEIKTSKKRPELFRRAQANLRSAIVALAVERHRLAEGHWPDSLDKLVPKYLQSLPTDFLHQNAIDLVIGRGPSGNYLIIRPGKNFDDGPMPPPLFRLWDVKDRHKPSIERAPKLSEKGG